jgi:PEP-CTERM motif
MPTAFLRKNSMAITIVLAALFLMVLPVQQARADNLPLGAHTQDLLHQTNTLSGVFLHVDYDGGGSWEHEKGHSNEWSHGGDKGDKGDKGTTKVPEPGSLALLVCGLLGLFIVAGGRRKAEQVS